MHRIPIGLVCGLLLVAGGDDACAGPLMLVSSSRSGNPDLFLIDVESGDTFNLTRHPGFDAYPAWSSDGKQIAFASARDDRIMHLYRIDSDGSNLKQLTDEQAIDRVPSFSPDGKRLAFSRRELNDPNGNTDTWVIDVDGQNARSIQKNAFDPAWSPDGKHIAFASGRHGPGFRLFLMDADGTKVQQLTETDNSMGFVYPAWSPDGKRIAFGELINNGVEVHLVDADGKNLRPLTRLGGLNIYPTWSPDGKRIAFQHHDSHQEPGPVYLMDADGGNTVVIPVLKSERYFEGARHVWQPTP